MPSPQADRPPLLHAAPGGRRGGAGARQGRSGGPRARAAGFTLIEVVVVLVVLGLGAALVAPSLSVRSQPGGSASLAAVLEHARAAALRRGETVVLRVAPGGAWDLHGASSAVQGTLSSGRVEGGVPASGFALRVSPFGSCGPTLESDAVAAELPIDPLTCRVTDP